MRPTARALTRGGDPAADARVILRCTAKALRLLGGSKLTLAEPPPTDDDWYLNLLWIERRKCLLLSHAGTLFSIVIADVRAADLRPPGSALVRTIAGALKEEGLPSDALGPLDPEAITLAKTASRSVLGHMKEIAFDAEHWIAHQGGLTRADIRALNHHLQRTLRNRDGYIHPIELVHARVGGSDHARSRIVEGREGQLPP